MSQPPKTTSSRLASGTKSLMRGERPSVRLPSRTVPIWVSDPNGFASPLRMAMHTGNGRRADGAHSHEQDTQLPCGFCDFRRIFHNRGLYHWASRLRFAASSPGSRFAPSFPTTRALVQKAQLDPLAVTMAGVKLGDRCWSSARATCALTAALAIKAGLTGRACVLDASRGRDRGVEPARSSERAR